MLAELLMSASSIHSTSVDGGTTLWAPEAAKLHIWALFRNFDSFPYLATNGLFLKTPLCKRRWSQCVHLSLILQPWQTLASEVVEIKQTQLAVSETANGSISYVFVTFHYECISFMPVGVTLKRKHLSGSPLVIDSEFVVSFHRRVVGMRWPKPIAMICVSTFKCFEATHMIQVLWIDNFYYS